MASLSHIYFRQQQNEAAVDLTGPGASEPRETKQVCLVLHNTYIPGKAEWKGNNIFIYKGHAILKACH